MTLETESADIGKVALPAAFANRHDMIRIPKAAAVAGGYSPVFFELPPRGVIELALMFAQCLGVETAQRADAAVAPENLLAKITGIAAQPPFVHARIGTKSESALRRLCLAPTAQISAIRSLG